MVGTRHEMEVSASEKKPKLHGRSGGRASLGDFSTEY